MVASGSIFHATASEPTWVDSQERRDSSSTSAYPDDSLQERIRSGLSATTRAPSQVFESVKLLGAGGIAGAFSKSCTAPLARLTILYQVRKSARKAVLVQCCLLKAVFSSSLACLVMCLTPSSLHCTAVEAYFVQISKTKRMPQVQALKASPAALGQLSLRGAFSHVVRQEGILALWKGNGVTVVHRIPYSAINFWAYERLTEFWRQHMPSEKSSAGIDCARRLAAGGLAGSLACAVVSAPHQKFSRAKGAVHLAKSAALSASKEKHGLQQYLCYGAEAPCRYILSKCSNLKCGASTTVAINETIRGHLFFDIRIGYLIFAR